MKSKAPQPNSNASSKRVHLLLCTRDTVNNDFIQSLEAQFVIETRRAKTCVAALVTLKFFII